MFFKMSGLFVKYIPISSYPEQYLPDYCNGPTYLMTPAALAALIEVVGMAKVFEVEDAFFTGVLARLAGVRVQNERGIWNRGKSSQPCINGQGTVISYPAHYASPKDLFREWMTIRSIRCRYPIEHFLLSFIMRD
ncbi:Hexosyltransferase [Trichostrongylus colubriformis]|uniref:Hexosyltransferase n=1 Tax=Trichostrongylus colubriformis TaxID=6319 RepID=A0AAN8FN82_TRICO